MARREVPDLLRRERQRAEREFRERTQAMEEAREQAERDKYAPALQAANPIRLVFTYKRTASGVRAEAVGLRLACESRTKAEARRGLMKMVKEPRAVPSA